MIAKHDDQCIFITFIQFLDIGLDKFVYVVDLVDVIFPSIGLFLGLALAGNANGRIFNDLVGRIITMRLDGNGIDEIRSLGRVQCLCGSRCQDVIGRPGTQRCIIGNIQHFLTLEGIKAHHGEGIGTAVEITPVIVYDMAAVTKVAQISRKTFTVCLL